MFVKEMQQFFRSLALKIAGLMIIASWIMVYFISQINLPDLTVMDEVVQEKAALAGASFAGYLLAIVLMNVAALISVLGSSAGRWRLELGDPAFAPGITTCTPPWKLAMGKWGALILQILSILLLCGLLPYWFGISREILACLAEDRRRTAAEAMVYLDKIPLVMICMSVVWSSMTLALCSLKPRSRSKVDIGMCVAMLWLAPQAFGLLFGSSVDNWVVNMLIRSGVLVTGSLALITAGVSAPGSNRLFFFKLWMALSGLVIMPLLWQWQGIYSAANWSDILIVLSVLFLLCSLFERLIQSRRVLAQLDNPVLAAIAFPFSTGALNSMVLAAVFAVAAHLADKMESGSIALLLFFAAAISLCNMAGFFFERRGVKFKRFIAFILLTAFIWALMAVGAVYECKYLLKHELGNAAVIFAVLTVVFNLPLIINYNCRKKGL